MTVDQLATYTSIILGEQTTFYSQEEIIRGGLNPAQRLLCLVYPAILKQRATITVDADMPFIDLRTLVDASGAEVGNRLRTVNRVVLGNVSGDEPVRNSSTGELGALKRISLKKLAARPNWLHLHGPVIQYWLWGKLWMGLYRRPVDTVTVTVMFDAIPAPLSADNLAASPSVQDTYHTVLAEVAAGILLIKEGSPEGERGLGRITQALNLQEKRDKAQQEAVTA